jgi:hypothetical protein
MSRDLRYGLTPLPVSRLRVQLPDNVLLTPTRGVYAEILRSVFERAGIATWAVTVLTLRVRQHTAAALAGRTPQRAGAAGFRHGFRRRL